MKKRIKLGLLLVMVSLFALVGCGNKSINDAQDVVDAIVADYDRSDGNQDYTEDDFSFKVYYSEMQDTYVTHAFVPYISDHVSNRGESDYLERIYFYRKVMDELDWTSSISQLPSVLTDGRYEEIYRSGKFDEQNKRSEYQ
ncbi:hypothetical protein [Enterococcus casseliflavus]|uniref:hypothetical protein n=1 Tax=Enterococcus casseliflavus TaxID=37734 RepID=UPI0022DFE354|nr:hypothetical protein [Enterococcus casseliflavus]